MTTQKAGATSLAKLGPLMVVLATSACSNTNLKLTVKPDRLLCPGTPVTVEWQASRAPTIVTTPAVAGLDDLPSFGSRQVSIGATTHFLLRAGDWWWARQVPMDARVHDAASGPTVLQLGHAGSEIHCSGDTAWLAFEQLPDNWDVRASIESVRSVGGAITVWHDGRRVQVDGAPSTAFQGLPITGVWLVETSCQPRPHVLGVELKATCNAGGATP